MKRLLSLLLTVYISACMSAQSRPATVASLEHDYLLSYITMENGLTNNYIDDVYKDNNGFVWIVTYGGGLLRYDGYGFLKYNINSLPFSIKSNFVKKVCEDNYGRLWVASEGGLDLIDLKTMSTIAIPSADDALSKYIHRGTYMLYNDAHGCLWVSTDNTVEKLEFDAEGKVIKVHELKSANMSTKAINAYCEIDGNLLMGFGNSLMKAHTDNSGHVRLKPYIQNTPSMPGTNYIISLTTKDHEVWIGTNDGLLRYNPAKHILRRYTHSDNDNHTLTQNLITNLQVTADNQLIVATLKGINVYDARNDYFINITQEQNSLNSNFINCLLCDKHTIWIGTESGGLNVMTRRRLPVTNYIHSPRDAGSISRGCVNSVYEDGDGNVWVGCMEGGLNMKTANGNTFTKYTTANGLSHNSVSVIIEAPDHTLWLGTWGGGINVFDKATHSVKGHINTANTGMDISFIGSMIYDKINKGIWIGSNRGIYFYDLTAKRLTAPLPQRITANISGSLGIIIDNKNVLWMGTTVGIIKVNLNSFHHNRKAFSCTLSSPQQSNRITAFRNKVTFFSLAKDGTMWIGTDGYGLVKARHGRYTLYGTREGLCNDVIAQIEIDNKNHLWLATANGLACFNPRTARFTNYYKQNGMADNQFFWNGSYKRSGSNHLYFGSVAGLIEIDADRANTMRQTDKVTLTTLTVGEGLVFPATGSYLDTDISKAKKIRLHESDKYISLEFSALDYESPASVVYQYRLLGFDEKWTTVSAERRFATYTNLPPGDYTFQVRCAVGSEEFSSNITEVDIHVSPYFYKTWWFILLVFALLAFIAYRTWMWRIRDLKRQRTLLQAKVKQRTQTLERQTKELSIQNGILTQQNEKITKQKSQLEEMAKKVQDLTMDKLAYFTNITHEFRTPVTLIIGPIERALKLSTNPKVIEQLKYVEHSSKHLLSLINQLMDFRKVETGNLTINYEPDNVVTLAEDVLLPFKAFANDKGISIRSIYHIADPYIMIDKEAMTKIFTNLFGNAIKYTPEGGMITLYMAAIGESKLYIDVSDTGSGLNEDDIEKIFQQFYQSKGAESQPGTGIGLYLCKRIVSLLGGDIKAQNNKGKGSSFRITLPISRLESRGRKATIEQTIDALNTTQEERDERMTILIVEDSVDMRNYIRSVLTDTYKVITASNGMEALKTLSNEPVDFIISDLMMPEMDGMQLAQKVKSNFATSHIPFLMLTAKTARDSQLEGLKNGVDDYILKPFDEEMLKARIAGIIDNRRRFQKRFQTNMVVDDLHIKEDSSDKKFIDKAIAIIKENYKNSYFEVSDFVEAMGVSKSLLSKKMQMLTGQSASQFIRSYRLNLAREMIMRNRITHNMNISEIAYEVGFNDPKYFTRCFTKQFSITPSTLLENEKE